MCPPFSNPGSAPGSQDEAVQKAAKKVKREKTTAFGSRAIRSNTTLTRVAKYLEEAAEEISKRPVTESALGKAKQAIKEGMRQISERRKLIKITDRSEYGWGVEAEYQADELASCSEDEKNLEKAERAAERKVMRKRKSTRPGSKGVVPKFYQPANEPYTMGVWSRSAGGQPGQQILARYQIPPPKPPATVGLCLYCGELGHLKWFCYKLLQRPARWYPCDR